MLVADLRDDVERVGVGILVDRQRAGRLAVEPAGGIVVLRVELDRGRRRASRTIEPSSRRRTMISSNSLTVVEPPLGQDRVFSKACPGGTGWPPILPGGRLAVLRPGWPAITSVGEMSWAAMPVGVEPDPHRVLAAERR